jgi:hypothetical protein
MKWPNEISFVIVTNGAYSSANLTKILTMLDYVDHSRRIELKNRNFSDKNREKILLLDEPIKWESSLQVIIDILMTNGGIYL